MIFLLTRRTASISVHGAPIIAFLPGLDQMIAADRIASIAAFLRSTGANARYFVSIASVCAARPLTVHFLSTHRVTAVSIVGVPIVTLLIDFDLMVSTDGVALITATIFSSRTDSFNLVAVTSIFAAGSTAVELFLACVTAAISTLHVPIVAGFTVFDLMITAQRVALIAAFLRSTGANARYFVSIASVCAARSLTGDLLTVAGAGTARASALILVVVTSITCIGILTVRAGHATVRASPRSAPIPAADGRLCLPERSSGELRTLYVLLERPRQPQCHDQHSYPGWQEPTSMGGNFLGWVAATRRGADHGKGE